ncbi:hypothetical protein [Tabrizicola sp.]|uniref:hypothetical protein n=1 Tax=Tabrizicola sp. TaxID=2005166 RepID=UPI00286C4E20|nr:hypothetical protein [Tabrizicola sp.]
MPLPLAPLVPLAMRLGLLTAASYAIKRYVTARSFPGRTDQRVEDAFDDLAEGVAVHRPADRSDATTRQTNTAARVVRVVLIGGRRIEIDVALMARLRIRKE